MCVYTLDGLALSILVANCARVKTSAPGYSTQSGDPVLHLPYLPLVGQYADL